MGSKLGSWGDKMQSKKLGRAAAAAGLMVLLAPTVAAASWWDGGYDGRYDGGANSRRGHSTTTTTGPRRAAPGYDQPPDDGSPGYSSPGESPPPDNSPPPQYSPPPDNTPPPSENQPAQPPPDSNRSPRYSSPPENDQGPGCCAAPAPPPSECCAAPAPPPPPPAPYGSIYGCENTDLEGTAVALHKTTTPSPGTPVAPGDEILVDITWRVSDWVAPVLHKALDCVYIDGHYVPGLSGGERETVNDGHFAYHYVVPGDAPVGGTICDQGFVSGPNGPEDYFREVSNVVCFPICAPASPPPPPPVVETTTTTTAPEEVAHPYTESERFDQSVPEETPPAPMVQSRDVLPRTGSGPAAARLAAAGLGLAMLIRRRTRRG